MSVIASYARLNAEGIELCRSNPDWLEALYSHAVPDSEVADVDKACDGIVWLLSRLPAPPSTTFHRQLAPWNPNSWARLHPPVGRSRNAVLLPSFSLAHAISLSLTETPVRGAVRLRSRVEKFGMAITVPLFLEIKPNR